MPWVSMAVRAAGRRPVENMAGAPAGAVNAVKSRGARRWLRMSPERAIPLTFENGQISVRVFIRDDVPAWCRGSRRASGLLFGP